MALELALVFLVLVTVMVMASRTFGLTLDEVTYFRYADSIREWWRAGAPCDAAALDRFWGYDTYSNPHPPFMKMLGAAATPLAEPWLPFPTSYRFGHFLWIAGCLTGVYALLRSRWPALAAVGALGFVAFQPRVFGHLLIAATDSPVALEWLLLALLTWALGEERRTPRRKVLWTIFFAVLGFAAATKLTGLLAALPIAVFFAWRRRRRDLALVVGAMAWAVVFVVAASPHLWHHPLAGAWSYLAYPFVRREMPFSVAYFGRLYRGDLPWHYADVMSLVTLPPALLVLAPAAGLARGALRRLILPACFGLAFWGVLVHTPGTPRHDEVRQFLSVFPLLGLLGWAGLLALLERLAGARPGWGRPASVGAIGLLGGALVALPAAIAHPFELSYYNRLIGGVRGAEDLGMELSLYFEAVDRETLAAIDRDVLPGQTLQVSPYWPKLIDAYVEHGLLKSRAGLVPRDATATADWLLAVRRRYAIDDRLFETAVPPAAHEVRYDGVSLVKLVRQIGAIAAAPGPPQRSR